MEIDRESAVPPYQQIARWLRAEIEAGRITSRLPSADDIVDATGVAKFTARKALHVLVDDGLVEIVPGLGTFVRKR